MSADRRLAEEARQGIPNTIRWQQDAAGVVVLVLDDPLQAANTMNDAYVESMERAVERLERMRGEITGVVLTSAKKTFFAGGDLNDLLLMDRGESQAIIERLRKIKRQLRSLETLGKPVVAAINGAALGGGLEIALATHHRIALEDRRLQLGFPEATLGLLPGAGGVVRSVRMLGVVSALSNLLLRGNRVDPSTALELGIVDELVASEDELVAAAKRWIAGNPHPQQAWDAAGFRLPGGTLEELSAKRILPSLAASLRSEDPGGNYPAQRHLLAVAVEGAAVDFDDACEIESRYFVALATGQVAKNMIQAFFFDHQRVRSPRVGDAASKLPKLRSAAVIGTGALASSVARSCTAAGLEVVRPGAGDGPGRWTADIRIDAGSDGSKPERSDGLPISTIVVADPAESDPDPAGVVRLRCLGEFDSAPLVELSGRDEASESALRLALALARKSGKTPIFGKSSSRPFVARLLAAVLQERSRMLDERVPAATIAQALAQAGYGQLVLRAAEDQETPIDLAAEGDASRRTASFEELKRRLLFAPVIAAVHALEEGGVESVAEANVGSIVGFGFPGWTGGVIQFINGYEDGPRGFVRQAECLAVTFGNRFAPPKSLVDLSEGEARYPG